MPEASIKDEAQGEDLRWSAALFGWPGPEPRNPDQDLAATMIASLVALFDEHSDWLAHPHDDSEGHREAVNRAERLIEPFRGVPPLTSFQHCVGRTPTGALVSHLADTIDSLLRTFAMPKEDGFTNRVYEDGDKMAFTAAEKFMFRRLSDKQKRDIVQLEVRFMQQREEETQQWEARFRKATARIEALEESLATGGGAGALAPHP